MADGPYRHYGAGTGQQQQYYYQHTQHPRHLTRNGSPVNNSRPSYNDTPSPSRSPVSQGSSNPFGGMFNPQSAQNAMMNGGGAHQRYMQMGVGHKYGHHAQQQQQQQQQQHHHHAQQNHHHHQQNHAVHAGHGGMGHQHTFSGGMGLNTSQNFNPGIQNGSMNDDQVEIDENYPEHWQQQLQLYADYRQGGAQSHKHSRKGAALLTKGPTTQPQAEDSGGEQVERNRVIVAPEEPRQDWDGMDMSGQGLRTLSMRLFQDYSFLTRLYVDGNRLSSLPFAISSLRSLTHLQASNNQIRELPETIGMLTRLEQLLLFDNQIRMLPPEIGYLYRLETLGIEGNPLDEETKEFLIRNGTAALVAHMRDNAEGL
jgi:CCR4-NOT transcription complex subunit 6